MKQREIIKQLSDKELKKQLFLSQAILLGIAILLSLIFFNSFSDWLVYIEWNEKEVLLFGIIPGLIIVIFDLFLMKIFPKHALDDGGINERILRGQPIGFIFLLSIFVSISEELLFRGVIQTTFGYIVASVIFALVHFRYLTKPILFVSIVMVSFIIGYLFEITENILVTIFAHFTVDFLLGLIIRFK
ncbi:CPBP family intramembrane glutamic endopeptidase [Oceanobacillus senegalensis]|uniref:CPBP family intramembrane glutamic endopeptidase n=1 Tax=Oceanobacillus senegalensis TaxID=1936063 RepID=UPI000A306902|nr:CPBP family intramembrane glutamic endopeptidase [Oceanobacillus senegalensis]